jgi:prefoldin subunit 5
MLRIVSFVLVLPIVALAPAHSAAADSPAVTALKAKGLSRSGRVFVIEAERSVLDRWKEIRTAIADHAAAERRKNEAERIEQETAQLEEHRRELQAQLDVLNQQINEQGLPQGTYRQGGFGQGAYVSQLVGRRNMILMNLSETVSTQKAYKSNSGTDQKSQEAEGKKSLAAVEAMLNEFRELVAAVTKQYDKLNADTAVIAALAALEKDKVGTFKLGPSPAFKNAIKALESAERSIHPKKTSTPTRRKSNSRR